MELDLELLKRALRLCPGEDDDLKEDLAVESMGDPAFDWIVHELRDGRLTPGERARGLRLLSRLTRHLCVPRKSELLELATALATDRSADRIVRSTAIHIAIINARIAEGLKDPETSFGKSVQDVQAQVHEAARRALDLGLTPEIEEFSRTYLVSSPRESEP
jgi:hypothetical protein